MSRVPPHLTTATLGAVSPASTFSSVPIRLIVSLPPTGQKSPSMDPESAALTTAEAKPEHPG